MSALLISTVRCKARVHVRPTQQYLQGDRPTPSAWFVQSTTISNLEKQFAGAWTVDGSSIYIMAAAFILCNSNLFHVLELWKVRRNFPPFSQKKVLIGLSIFFHFSYVCITKNTSVQLRLPIILHFSYLCITIE